MPVPVTVRAVERVLVALQPDTPPPGGSEQIGAPTPASGAETGRATISSGERIVLAAEVLAYWFGASLQFVTTDNTASVQLEQLSGSIGLRTEPVVVLPPTDFDARLSQHAEANAPSLVVAAAGPATMACATTNQQPTYLVPPGPKRRQPSGPLVVGLPDDEASEAALALAAVWAQALDVPLILVSSPDPQYEAEAGRVISRLETMGVQVESAPGADPAQLVADGDALPLAVVLPAASVGTSPLAQQVLAAGRSVLAAPATTAVRQAEIDLDDLQQLSAALGGTSDDAEGMSADECAAVLVEATVGRIGYVDHGWPVVVPVNYAIRGRDIFIRSLRGGKLAAAERNDRVCFEVDTFDVEQQTGASVLIHGRLELIIDPAVLQTAWANEPSPWIDGDQMLWLRLVAVATSGRRVG